MSLHDVLKPDMKGVFYGRHSTKKQKMDTQIKSAYDLAEKYGCIIISEYKDAGVSSRKALNDREAIASLLTDARGQKFEFVVVYSDDRLARNRADHKRIREELAALNIPIVISTTESLYTTKDLIVHIVKDGITSLELARLRQKTRDTMRTIIRNGKWRGGPAPFGYVYQKHAQTIQPRHNELELVRQVYERYSKNEGFNSIAKGMPPGSYRGRNWTKDDVKQIIANPFYAGYLTLYRRKPNFNNTFTDRNQWLEAKSAEIEPIITFEEWQYCWDLYQQRKTKKISPKFYNTSFLLNNLLHCKNCGGAVSGKDGRTTSNTGKTYGVRLYRCTKCKYKIEESLVDAIVKKIWRKINEMNDETIVSNVIDSFQKDCEKIRGQITDLRFTVIDYQNKYDSLDQKIKLLFQDQLHREDLIKALSLARQNVYRQIQETNQAIKKKQQVMNFIQEVQANPVIIRKKYRGMIESYDSLPLKEIRRFLLQMVESITIDENGNVEYKLRIFPEEESIVVKK